MLIVALPVLIFPEESLDNPVFSIPFILYSFIGYTLFFLSGLGVTIRRFHDMNRSGWNALLLLVLIYNIIVQLELFFKAAVEPNTYGPADTKLSVPHLFGLRD